MKKNKIKQSLKNGETIFCGWLHIPNTWSAEIMANAGWDCLTVDMQHGLQNIETAMQMMQAISTTETVPLARANWNDPGTLMRLLDMGACGIICPMINTVEQCEQFVQACLYPPLGYRSFGPTRQRIYSGQYYGEHANEETLILAMIETKEAVENIEAIASINNLDGIFVGSGDLRLSLTGTNKITADNDIFDHAINQILDTCKTQNIVPGIWVPNVEQAKIMIQKGFQFIALQSDSMMLTNVANQLSKQLKALK